MKSELLYREHGDPTHALIQIRVHESESWVKFFSQRVYSQIVSNLEVNPYLSIWISLVFSMNNENCYFGTQAGLASELHVSTATMSRGLRKLDEYGFVKRIHPKGGHQGWFINPYLAFCGTPKARRAAMQKWNQKNETEVLF